MDCQVKIVLQHDEDGYYAYAPELKECQTQGDTLEEALGNIREAVEVYLDSLAPAERSALLSTHGI